MGKIKRRGVGKSSAPLVNPPSGIVGASSPDPATIALALRERVKELECLYTISKLRERHPSSRQEFLQGVVDCLPRSWQFPQYASARLTHHKSLHVTRPFHEGPWRLVADIVGADAVLGRVELFYSRGVPLRDGDPFLPEERTLLHAVAERVGDALRHMQAETELAEAHRSLRAQHQIVQENNITLRSVLSTLEDEKREIRAAILMNIEKVIMPIVFELELAVTGRPRSYATLLRQSLQEIASPFYGNLAREHVQLTPVEVAISAMIRNGMSTKEIAQLRAISPATVRRHRENIRRKLGLQNRRANLVTFLQNEGHPARAGQK